MDRGHLLVTFTPLEAIAVIAFIVFVGICSMLND